MGILAPAQAERELKATPALAGRQPGVVDRAPGWAYHFVMPNKRFHPLILLGLGFLVVASILKWVLHPASPSGKDAADAVTGLFYGLAIGAMLFGIWRSRTRADGTPAE